MIETTTQRTSEETVHPTALFASGTDIEVPTVRQLMVWRTREGEGALLLPPIQRSLVWRNEQIVHYWDSLLRGYPPGLFLVHKAGDATGSAFEQGSDEAGVLQTARAGDWQLFDGQQRVTSLLLGRGEGQLQDKLRLWVELGHWPKSPDFRFALRISSTGQPFGYREDEPNRKFPLGERQERWEAFTADDRERHEAFAANGPKHLIGATCAVPLADAVAAIKAGGVAGLVDETAQMEGADAELVEKFGTALQTALNARTIVKRIDEAIVGDPDEYVRFFGRIGRGGTPLSSDELTYSLIKQRFPHVRDRVREIAEGPAGRLAGPVDLVLGAMRVARVLVRRERGTGGVGRPDPRFVSQFKPDDPIEGPFGRLFPHSEPKGDGHDLGTALVRARDAIQYDRQRNPTGLPTMLLARMPSELVDMLVLFAVLSGDRPWEGADREALHAFALHLMLFVSDHAKAGNHAFEAATEKGWAFNATTARELVAAYERDGIAWTVPREHEVGTLRAETEGLDNRLRPYVDRFKSADDGGHQPGEALRALATNRRRTMNALLWLQRHHIHEEFKDYDPTSGRDEDLPVDLDHVVPHDLFGFHWGSSIVRTRLAKDQREGDAGKNFHRERGGIGNSLGNYRWLCRATNRARGKNKIEDGKLLPMTDSDGATRFDLVENVNKWNSLIPGKDEQQHWTSEDVARFHRLIEGRAVALYDVILREGIAPVVPAPPTE